MTGYQGCSRCSGYSRPGGQTRNEAVITGGSLSQGSRLADMGDRPASSVDLRASRQPGGKGR